MVSVFLSHSLSSLLCVFLSVSSLSPACTHVCTYVCTCVQVSVTHKESGWQVAAPPPGEHRALTLLHRNTHASLSPSILTLCAVQTASHTQIRHPPPSLCSVRCPPGGSEHGEGALVISRQGACLSLSSVHGPNRIPLAEVLGVFCCKG